MKNRFSLGLAALTAAGIGLVSSIPAPGGLAQNAKLKVAFIYIGPPGDFGWTYAHEQGRIALEKALPDVETIKVENVPEGQAGPFLDQVIKDGAKVIFTTSFGYMDPTLEAAKITSGYFLAASSVGSIYPKLVVKMTFAPSLMT